jgi:hypothetical protein
MRLNLMILNLKDLKHERGETNTMKIKTKLLALMLSLSLATGGCAALKSWFDNFVKDPIAQIQAFEQEVQTILTTLEAAWQFILPLIPASAQPAAQQQYANAVASVGHAEAVLQDAVKGAVAAKQEPMPDFAGLTQAITDAVSQVIAVIDTYGGNIPMTLIDGGVGGARPRPPGLDEARARNARLHTFKVQTP